MEYSSWAGGNVHLNSGDLTAAPLLLLLAVVVDVAFGGERLKRAIMMNDGGGCCYYWVMNGVLCVNGWPIVERLEISWLLLICVFESGRYVTLYPQLQYSAHKYV